MSYGTYAWNKIQLGRESTAGTAVAATTIWRGPATDITDEREHVFAEEDVGILVPAPRHYVPKIGAKLVFPETELTFEQVLHLFEAGIKTATPTGTGPYVRLYEFALATTPNTIKTYTIETGNAVAGDVNEMEYSYVDEFTLSGERGQAWKMASTWMGRQKSTSSFTGALSLLTVEEALFQNTTLYIDAEAGTVGTTAKAGVLTAASINVKTGIQQVWVPSGQLYFYKHKFVRPEVTFSLTLELENDSGILAAQRAAMAAKTMQLFQLSIAGTGTTVMELSWAGKYSSFGEYQNSDGDTMVEMQGKVFLSSTANLFFKVDHTSGVVTVP